MLTGSSSQPNKNLNESKITTSILPPQITSTPCISPSKSRKASPLITPRRFLGPRRYAVSSNGTLTPFKTIKNLPGPLLTSTSYNVNVSTYIDSKSPGYTGRLIQYNEESSRHQQLTHQEKYGSPGLFPIVHLFKKDVPIITPKQTTVRIGTPDIKGHYSQDHNRLLLEGIVKSNSVIKENSHSGNDVSTRSVLDALKEISRKRIHATEEYERDDSNKKLKIDFIKGDGDCSKRHREVDSPTSDESTSPVAMHAMKKLCTIDAVLASKTSSMYANYDIGNKRRSVGNRKTMVSPLNKKKFNNAETQTMNAPSQKTASVSMETDKGSLEQKETVHKQTQSNIIVEEIESPPKQVLKIFDDKPLEVIRKNRLGALLSALTGQEIPPIPLEDRRKALDQDWPQKKPEKELVSILSSPDKPPRNRDKHVTFNMSENSTSTTQSTENTLLPNNSTEVFKVNSLEQKGSTEIQDETKYSNLKLTQQSSGEKPVDKEKDDVAIPSIGGFKLGSTKAVEPTLGPSGGFKFDLSKPPTTVKDVIDKKSFPQSNSSTDVASITEPKKNLISSNVADSSPSSTPSVLSKFGINHELSTSLPLNNSLSDKNVSLSVSLSTKTNSLGLPTALPVTTSQSSFGKGTSVSFNFGSPQSVNTSNSPAKSKPDLVNNEGSFKHPSFLVSNVSEPKISSTSSTNTSIPKNDVNCTLNFKPQTIPDNLSVHSPSALGSITDNTSGTDSNTPLLTSTPNFGIIESSKTSTAFGVSTSISTFEGSSKNKEFTATSSSIQGGLITSVVSSSTPNSTTTVTRTGGFIFTNSLPAFPAKSTLGSETSISKPSNNTFSSSSNLSDLQKNIAFGTTKTTPSYDTVSSSKLGYSSPGSTQPTFMFGSGKSFVPPSNSATSTTSTINSQSGMTLGTNTSASTASNVQVKATGNAFSSAGNNILEQNKSIASFGTTSTPGFGNAITATFGTTSSPAFGISTSSSSTKPVFGNSSMDAFGTTIAPTFGSTTSPAFGTTTTPTFGTTTTPTFGTTTAPTFGVTSVPTFGATTTSTFGNTTVPTFGTTTAPTFGTTTAPSFGSNTVPTFGTSRAGFGTTAGETFGTNIAPTFGSTSATIFGTTSAPTFGTNNAPTFGTNNTPSFGTTTAASFGTSGTPSFTTSAFGINTTSSTFGTSNVLNFSAPNMNSSTFGNTSNFAAPSGTKSLFATTNTLPFENTKTTTGGFATSNNFAVPSTASNTFGTGTSSFGAPSSNPLFATTNTSTFVSSSTTPSFGTTTATFGAPLAFGTTPTTSVGTFNSNNPNLPFGNSSTNSFNTFGNANSTFNPVTTAPGFGTNNNFVNSAPTNFGNNMANNAFGNTNTASPFGTVANATTFGTNNAAGTNGFGSGFGGTTSKSEQSNVFASQTNPMFGNSSNFGSLQSNNTANQGVSSNGVFTFGSPNTQTSLSNGVFAFGATESSKPFNFSAPGTPGNVSGPSASSFQAGSLLNGAVPNMFNIGSGSSSTQNRSRQTTRAKRRT